MNSLSRPSLLLARSGARVRGVRAQLCVAPLRHALRRDAVCVFSSVSASAGAADAAVKTGAVVAAPSLAAAFAELCKARLSALVVVTSGAGFLLAGHDVDWVACGGAVIGTALAAAAANTFNQVIERAPDALMKRTAGRPLPTGRLSVRAALLFGSSATVASAALLLATTNPLTAGLGLANIALYALVYTPLKRVTTWNTAVGAIVGAVPPLMGWAAATGSLVAVDPFLLATMCFSWQFPHFYSLAWPLRKDYARGGYAMVPVFDATGARTGALVQRHAAGLAVLPLAASALGITSPMFALEGLVLNGYFFSLASRFRAAPDDARARAVFRASLWYLPLLMALFVFHANHWREVEDRAAVERSSDSVARIADLDRGTSWGDAAEHAIGVARLIGREACAHESSNVRAFLGRLTAAASGPLPAAVALCPVPSSHAATTPAPSSPPAAAKGGDSCPVSAGAVTLTGATKL